MDIRAFNVLQVTGWIPLLDTNHLNGCLELAPGGHLRGKVAKHTAAWKDTWYIMLEEEEMAQTLGVDVGKDVKCCPVPYGGILLYNNILPHRTLPNVSNNLRWTLDLRWQRADKNAGFYDLKPGIQMRKKDAPDFQIDWDPFMSISPFQPKGKDARFNTIMQGPWMSQWEIPYPNKHSRALKAVPTSQRSCLCTLI